jgi:Fungal Zn(2)-Cys(6) binuclear cluster domain
MASIPPRPSTAASKHAFVRSYQACVPCRKRKVKCDLGDPGNPSEPPCRRCRREHKECFFQDLRTKKGNATQPTPPPPKRTRLSDTNPQPLQSQRSMSDSQADAQLSAELFRLTPSAPTRIGSALSPNDSATADRILHKEVHNANEALNLLYEAAAEGRLSGEEDKALLPNLTRQASGEDPNSIAWREFWCVKAGWITSTEARDYVDLFTPFEHCVLTL